ncbi:MAG: hypothetical protein N3A55_11205 [Methylohalobius sp.]|nr:hypothetical protein [Methylohalobius sp.]
MRAAAAMLLVLALIGCRKQANQALDKNPKYAGRPDIRTAATAKAQSREEMLRQRALLIQTDR